MNFGASNLLLHPCTTNLCLELDGIQVSSAAVQVWVAAAVGHVRSQSTPCTSEPGPD